MSLPGKYPADPGLTAFASRVPELNLYNFDALLGFVVFAACKSLERAHLSALNEQPYISS